MITTTESVAIVAPAPPTVRHCPVLRITTTSLSSFVPSLILWGRRRACSAGHATAAFLPTRSGIATTRGPAERPGWAARWVRRRPLAGRRRLITPNPETPPSTARGYCRAHDGGSGSFFLDRDAVWASAVAGTRDPHGWWPSFRAGVRAFPYDTARCRIPRRFRQDHQKC